MNTGKEKEPPDKGLCPICQMSPCSELCPIAFTKQELDNLRDILLGRKSKPV